MPRALRDPWPLVLRTRIIDALLATCLADGCDRVVNLAAGFDTRPYRMDLAALADDAARSAFLREATKGAAKVLVLTEGLLMHLEEAVVRRLARDLHDHDAIRWWMLDLHSPPLREMMRKRAGAAFENAPTRFAPEAGVGWFESMGWRAREVTSVIREAARQKRLPLLLQLLVPPMPDPDPRDFGRQRWYGIVRLERA